MCPNANVESLSSPEEKQGNSVVLSNLVMKRVAYLRMHYVIMSYSESRTYHQRAAVRPHLRSVIAPRTWEGNGATSTIMSETKSREMSKYQQQHN